MSSHVIDDIEGVCEAHRRVMTHLDPPGGSGLSDSDVRRASRLPGWSVGHVLAHLALDAESLVLLVEFTDAERIAFKDSDGARQRLTFIDRRSQRLAVEHIEDLRRSFDRLDRVWSSADIDWGARVSTSSGDVVSMRDLPLRRWREVEVHMGDLGLPELGCDGPECWSQEYVRRDVRVLTMQWEARGSMGMNTLPSRIAGLQDRWRLAWLLGRHDVAGELRAGLV